MDEEEIELYFIVLFISRSFRLTELRALIRYYCFDIVHVDANQIYVQAARLASFGIC
jgi:hypothetical protein